MIFSKQLFDILTEMELYIAPFRGNGYIITQKGVDRHVNGIVDDIPNYFYIDWQKVDIIAFERDDDKDVYLAAGQFQIIARTSGYDVESVLENILGVLMDNCKVDVQDCSIDAAAIFEAETDGELKADLDLIRVRFGVTKAIKLKRNCVPLICKEC